MQSQHRIAIQHSGIAIGYLMLGQYEDRFPVASASHLARKTRMLGLRVTAAAFAVLAMLHFSAAFSASISTPALRRSAPGVCMVSASMYSKIEEKLTAGLKPVRIFLLDLLEPIIKYYTLLAICPCLKARFGCERKHQASLSCVRRKDVTWGMAQVQLEVVDNSHQHAGIPVPVPDAALRADSTIGGGSCFSALPPAPPFSLPLSFSHLSLSPLFLSLLLSLPSPPPPSPAGHAGVNGRDGETHFAVDIVSNEFEGVFPLS
eukprot:2532431-Rhodomonas_salina.3